MALVIVEVWSDVICPWCYIGKRRFETARQHLAARGIADFEVVYRAYQLDPGAPTDHPTPALEGYAKKFGGHQRALQITDHVSEVARTVGLEFWMDRALRANTMLAHRGMRRVLDIAGANAQGDANENLMRAYFTEGFDLGDAEVVADCCAVGGIRRAEMLAFLGGDGLADEVRADIAAATERDITAVPTFVVDDRFAIPGAQDVEVFERVLERMASGR